MEIDQEDGVEFEPLPAGMVRTVLASRARFILQQMKYNLDHQQDEMLECRRILRDAHMVVERLDCKNPREFVRAAFEDNWSLDNRIREITQQYGLEQLTHYDSVIDIAHALTPHISDWQ